MAPAQLRRTKLTAVRAMTAMLLQWMMSVRQESAPAAILSCAQPQRSPRIRSVLQCQARHCHCSTLPGLALGYRACMPSAALPLSYVQPRRFHQNQDVQLDPTRPFRFSPHRELVQDSHACSRNAAKRRQCIAMAIGLSGITRTTTQTTAKLSLIWSLASSRIG